MATLELVRPRLWSAPKGVGSAGAEAVDLARTAGLVLDPWQAFVLEHSLRERADGKWAAFEVGLVVPRQNGKGSILEARELAGLFLLGERLIIHSAHEFSTSLEAFRRLLELIENTPELDQRVKRVSKSHGEEGIELKDRQRVRFRTRTKSGGRGLTGDCVILDEAMILPQTAVGALMFTVSARPNPQIWYTGSAVDQTIHHEGRVLAGIRSRGVSGDKSLAYFEWSLEADSPDDVSAEVASDRGSWQVSNPALDIRVSSEHVEKECRSMLVSDPRAFAVERLGVGDWPAVTDAGGVIAGEAWDVLADARSVFTGDPWFGFDVAPDRSVASIVAACRREDGRVHVEIVDRREGSSWVIPRLADLVVKHGPRGVVCDGASPAAALVDGLRARDVFVETLSTREYVSACGQFYDGVEGRDIVHLGDRVLAAAVRAGVKRPLVDSWAWSRRSSAADITPLVAATVAAAKLWGERTGELWV